MRCHMPPFGLRFYSAGDVIAQASICWECNNIYGEVKGRKLYYGFDASQAASRELLALAERVIGHPSADAS